MVGAYENLLYLLIIVCNILIGIVQDVRAKRIVEKLSLLSAPSVRVIRGGAELRILPEALARGDEFILSRGDQVCADATVLSGSADVNEALLTGEAAPINKKPGDTLLS
jgi:cation-transporting ATPase E